MRGTSSSLAFVLAMSVAACATDDITAEDLAADVEEDEAKSDVTYPYGTFQALDEDAPLDTLTLNEDKTFEARQCGSNGICAGTRGTFAFTRSGSTRYLRLTDPEENLSPSRFAWKWSRSDLSLRAVNTTEWFRFEKEDDTEGASCGGFAGLTCG